MTVKISFLSTLSLWHLAMPQLQILASALLCAAADGSEAFPLSRYTEPWGAEEHRDALQDKGLFFSLLVSHPLVLPHSHGCQWASYLWAGSFPANGFRICSVKDQVFPGFWSLVPRTEEAYTDYNVTRDFIQKQNDNTDQMHGKRVEGSLS